MTHLFNKTVDVLRVTSTNTALGSTEVVTTHIEDLPCRLQWTSGSERTEVGKSGKVRACNMYCSVVDIVQEDRISYNEKTYEILNIVNLDEADRYLKIELGIFE